MAVRPSFFAELKRRNVLRAGVHYAGTAWALSQGIKRESEVASNTSITHSTARKLDFAIIGMMAVAIVLLASGYFIRRHSPPAGAAP